MYLHKGKSKSNTVELQLKMSEIPVQDCDLDSSENSHDDSSEEDNSSDEESDSDSGNLIPNNCPGYLSDENESNAKKNFIPRRNSYVL